VSLEQGSLSILSFFLTHFFFLCARAWQQSNHEYFRRGSGGKNNARVCVFASPRYCAFQADRSRPGSAQSSSRLLGSSYKHHPASSALCSVHQQVIYRAAGDKENIASRRPSTSGRGFSPMEGVPKNTIRRLFPSAYFCSSVLSRDATTPLSSLPPSAARRACAPTALFYLICSETDALVARPAKRNCC